MTVLERWGLARAKRELACMMAATAVVLAAAAGCGGASGATAVTSTPQQAAAHPCRLVTQAQAASALHVALQAPREAPLGPTCVLQAKSGPVVGTLAVQRGDLSQVSARAVGLMMATEAGRATYCGTLGQPTLWAPLDSGSMLVISAPCNDARALAAIALRRIS